MEIAGVEKVRPDLRVVDPGAFDAGRAIRRGTSQRPPRSDRDVPWSGATKSVFNQYFEVRDGQSAAGEMAVVALKEGAE